MRIKDEIFCFAHLRWCHNGWASNILIVVDTGYAGIHHSKYWMPIHYDTIEDGQNKKSHLLFSKRLKFYPETSHASELSHFAGKVTSSSPKIGKSTHTNIGQITIHLFILETWKRSNDGCVINILLWPMTAVITPVTRMDSPEWLSMQSLPVALLARLFMGPRDYWRLGARIQSKGYIIQITQSKIRKYRKHTCRSIDTIWKVKNTNLWYILS